MKPDLWRVKVAQAVVEMTIDELVQAFQSGQIEKATPVIAPGDLRWTTLGAVADLGDDDDEVIEAAPASIAPLTSDIASDMKLAEAATQPVRTSGRAGRAIGIVATYLVLIVVGAGAGAYRAAPEDVRGKLSSMKVFSKKAAASPPVVVAAARPKQEEPPPAAAPVAPAPVPTPVAAPAPEPSTAGTSVDSLPSVKQAATKKSSPRRRAR